MDLHLTIIAAEEIPRQTMRWAMMTLVTIVLLFVMFVVGLLLVRAMRRHRERLERARAKPTEYIDAWSMHQVPEDAYPQARGGGRIDDAGDENDAGDDDDTGDEEQPK